MKALIFNSGVGNRMGEFTRDHHKSMARLSNGETIFGRQLRLLAAVGVRQVVVTTGPHVEQLRAVADQFANLEVSFVANDRYDQTNYIYSMYLARDLLADDVVMLHGDLVFTRTALTELLADPRPDLGAVNTELPLPEKDFKARIVDGEITEVSVTIQDEQCVTFQPMYKLSRRVLRAWLDRVEDFVEEGTTGVYAENALNTIAPGLGIAPFSYAGQLVAEVDTLEDLALVSAEARLCDADEQIMLTGADAPQGLVDHLVAAGVSRPFLVSGSAYRGSVIEDALNRSDLTLTQFTDYSPNPRQPEVEAAVAAYRAADCDAVVAVGGGSAIDVAKCVALLVASGQDSYPGFGAPLERQVPLIAVPTTAGTGSESTHFAVVYIEGEKHSIAHDAILPQVAVLEPELLRGLPEYHKKASILDALAQCVESVWAVSATPRSRGFAVEGIELILTNYFDYFHKSKGFDPEVTATMQRAANLSGRAINLTKTTAAHAMSYGLTAAYGLAHGHAAALSLRAVWRQYILTAREGSDDPAVVRLREALDLLQTAFKAKTWEQGPEKLDLLLRTVGLYDPIDVSDLVSGVNAERLGNSPVPSTEADLRRAYEVALNLRRTPVPGAENLVGPRDLPDLQEVELSILAQFDQYCQQAGLHYYLSEGSLLGAVRHGGMIPWDDDIDVMMPRPEFDRLLDLAQAGELPEGLHLDSFTSNPRHWVFGAKLQLTTPHRFHQPQVAHVATHNGPHIDIFPVDPVKTKDGWKFKVQAYALRGLRRALFMSSGRSRGLRRNLVARVPIFLVAKVVPTPIFHKLVAYFQTDFNGGKNSPYWANLCSYYPLHREVFPKEWFGEGQRVDFDGLSAVIPDQSEQMLATIYGPNWAGVPTLGDEGDRHHNFSIRQL